LASHRAKKRQCRGQEHDNSRNAGAGAGARVDADEARAGGAVISASSRRPAAPIVVMRYAVTTATASSASSDGGERSSDMPGDADGYTMSHVGVGKQEIVRSRSPGQVVRSVGLKRSSSSDRKEEVIRQAGDDARAPTVLVLAVIAAGSRARCSAPSQKESKPITPPGPASPSRRRIIIAGVVAAHLHIT
jgi:hypothetical protein